MPDRSERLMYKNHIVAGMEEKDEVTKALSRIIFK